MAVQPGERDPLLGPAMRHGSSINNIGGLLEYSSEDTDNNTPTASVTYSSVQCEQPKLYTRRWFCLFIYGLLCFVSGLAMSALSSLAHVLQAAFGWNHAGIALMNSTSPFMYILSIGFCTWLLDTKGLRVAFLFAAFGLTAGTGIRCITSTPPFCDWTFNIGQLLIGLAGPACSGAPTTFSNTWFPPDQRTTATAFAAIAYALGIGIGSVAAPLLVRVRYKNHNASIISNLTTPVPVSNTTDIPPYIREMRASTMFLMYLQFAISLGVLVAMLIYFPAKPPTPPSVSASTDRVQLKRGLFAIFRRGQFWLMGLMFALTNGTITGFAGLLDVDLNAAQVPGDQLVSGWMSLGSLVAATFSCIIVSGIADRQRQYIKYTLMVLFVVATGAFVWFALIIDGVAPATYVSLYISYILGSLLVLGCIPVFMELACDVTYPISEGLTTGTLSVFSSAISLIFCAIFMIPNVGTRWMNWVMTGSAALCIPLLIPFTPTAGRMQIDAQRPPDDDDNEKA